MCNLSVMLLSVGWPLYWKLCSDAKSFPYSSYDLSTFLGLDLGIKAPSDSEKSELCSGPEMRGDSPIIQDSQLLHFSEPEFT